MVGLCVPVCAQVCECACVFDSVTLRSPGWSGTYYVEQADPKVVDIQLPLPPEYLEYTYGWPLMFP